VDGNACGYCRHLHKSQLSSCFLPYFLWLLFFVSFFLSQLLSIFPFIRGSSVSVIMTRLWPARSGFESRQGLGFFLPTTTSRQARGPTQPPVQWAGVLTPGVKRPGHEADHLHLVPSSGMRGAIPLFPHASSWRGA
jgi:hypothetical protein